MKRSCYGCRALVSDSPSFKCALHHQIEVQIDWMKNFPITNASPLEECKKPKTYEELIYLKTIKNESLH